MVSAGERGPGDDLDISSGGIVAVDTDSLRAAAGRLRLIAADCDGVLERLEAATRVLSTVGIWLYVWTSEAAAAGAAARRLASDLVTMADLYELVEVQAAVQAADASGDHASAGALRARGNALLSASPGLLALFAFGWWNWRGGTSPGAGTLPKGTTLIGPSWPVVTTALAAGRTTAPTGLTQLADRIPKGEGRVRVERYTMPDGSRRFVTYLAGTAFGGPSDEAWDMSSNLALYTRSRSASYDAVLAALAQAGVEPGDTVDLVGHSQGAMLASYLALSDRYHVPLLVTFGDPSQAEVGEETLSVAVRHLDDPVSALAGAGFATGVGAAGSFVASRRPSDTPGAPRGFFDTHHLTEYRRTAAALDASPDPRLGAVRERLSQLGAATSVEATVYGAARAPTATNRTPLRHPPGRGVSDASAAGAG